MPRWRAVLALQAMTDDGRAFPSLDWRDLPLTLMTQTVNDYEHRGAFVSGRIDTIEKFGKDDAVLISEGVWNDDDEGAKAASLAQTESLTGVSIDALGQAEWVCSEYETVEDSWGIWNVCADGFVNFPQATILAATQVPTPAFAAARMYVIPDNETDEERAASIAEMVTTAEALLVPIPDIAELAAASAEPGSFVAARAALVASIAIPSEFAPPLEPPAAWFEVPEPDYIVPLHIRADGSVVGHVAPWKECHIGIDGMCVTPPPSTTEPPYDRFHLGSVLARDAAGKPVAVEVGQVTLTTGHADVYGMDARAALAHYDNTGAAVADVRLMDGNLGIWACGAARTTTTPEQVREFNATGPSGDWRPIHGERQLVAVLQVNVPGFALVASAIEQVEDPDRPGRIEVRQGALVAGLHSRQGASGGLALVHAERKERKALAKRVDNLERLMGQILNAGGRDSIFESLTASIEQG